MTSCLTTYLSDIARTPLLSADQEAALARRLKGADPEDARRARDHLIRANLRLVVNVARRYQGRGLALEDLIAEGNLGLFSACRKFDHARGVRFTTYATFWVKQKVRRALGEDTRAVRLPAYLLVFLRRCRRAAEMLAASGGRPDAAAATLAAGLTGKRAACARSALLLERLDNPGGMPLEEAAADGRGATPADALEAADDLESLPGLLRRLDERSRRVLALRFGLGGVAPACLRDVARALGVSRERVRQIECRALGCLRRAMGLPDPPGRRRRRRVG